MTISDIDDATLEQLAPILHMAIQRLGELGRPGSIVLAALIDSEDIDFNFGYFWLDSINEGLCQSSEVRRKGCPMWRLRYFMAATRLLLQGQIRWFLYRKVLRELPIAVAGRDGAYQLHPNF